jgi:hypothetical protein
MFILIIIGAMNTATTPLYSSIVCYIPDGQLNSFSNATARKTVTGEACVQCPVSRQDKRELDSHFCLRGTMIDTV